MNRDSHSMAPIDEFQFTDERVSNLLSARNFSGGSIMIWGGHTELTVIVRGSLTADQYI